MKTLVMATVLVGALQAIMAADAAAAEGEQTMCPVLPENKIDPHIYVDYQGKRVYFCCNGCKAAFEKEPARYLAKLPQFSAAGAAPAAGSAGDHRHEHAADASQPRGLRLHRYTEPLGITTFGFLAATLATGLLRRKLKQKFLNIHRALAFTTGALAVTHALTVLLGTL